MFRERHAYPRRHVTNRKRGLKGRGPKTTPLPLGGDIARHRYTNAVAIDRNTPLATHVLFASIVISSSSFASNSMITPLPKPQHLMDRHCGGAENDRNIAVDLVDRRQDDPAQKPYKVAIPMVRKMLNDQLVLKPLSAAQAGAGPIEWRITSAPVGYEEAISVMEARAAAIANGQASELVWLLEHPALFTAGTGARGEDLAGTDRFPVHMAGRGGKLTYHGPGQRVAYTMLDLRRRGADVRRYMISLEEWIIRTLARFDVQGERRADRVGVWVRRLDKGEGFEDKIAALGIRVKRWITMHGISINVDPDLSHYNGVLACGIAEQKLGVTSLADLSVRATMKELDVALKDNFRELFGHIDEISETLPDVPSREIIPQRTVS